MAKTIEQQLQQAISLRFPKAEANEYLEWMDEKAYQITTLESRIATLQAQWHELGNEMENETGNMPADREPTVQEVMEQVRLLKSQLAATKEWYDETYAQRATLQAQADKLAAALGHALAEWAIYADATRNIPITEGRDTEAKMYQKDDAVLDSYREFRGEGG